MTEAQPCRDRAGPRTALPLLTLPYFHRKLAELAGDSEQVKDRLLLSARLKRAHTHAHTCTHTPLKHAHETHSWKNSQSHPKCSWAFGKGSHPGRTCLVFLVLAPLPEPDSYLTIVLTRPPTAKGHLQTSQDHFHGEFPALHHTHTPGACFPQQVRKSQTADSQ